MQAFMLYMSGGGVQVFSIGIVFMLMFSPFKNVAAINTGTHPNRPRNPPTDRHERTHTHSIRSVRPITFVVQIIQRPVLTEDRLYSCKYDDDGVGAVQMQFDGSVADGNRGLAGVRDSGTGM
jgi:hypothetical protein